MLTEHAPVADGEAVPGRADAEYRRIRARKRTKTARIGPTASGRWLLSMFDPEGRN
jgi:hypothetical protein